ncbi:hypothetical protein G4B88_023512 [Cannabis sativa]|uniref:Uncharacterized protein n=2 Tax=Cannabis sativa TaxID=3483 RepID=A0A7J6HW28_CANSA|nr:hypothetical protein G4B88_023512 [Cannabis sativa]
MELKMKQKLMVTPSKPTWKGNQSLSVWDQIGCTTHTSVIYFYAPNTTPFETVTQTLIDSLSHTLLHFYPLAGRLRNLDNSGFQLECNEDGAVFVVAELNADLSHFEKDHFTPTPESNRFLIPYINESLPIHERPLLLVQLTKLSCGGLSLGITMSHVVVDGVSAASFTTEWARIARGLPLQNAPLFDKKAFGVGDCCVANPHQFDHSNDFCNKMPFLLKQSNAAAPTTTEERKKMETTLFTLKLTKEQVQKLKNKANNNDQDRRSRPYTCYEALTAHIWRCSVKARKNLNEQVTACLVSVDLRQRLQPPLPLSYFGNGAFQPMASCEAGELLCKPLSYGVSKVRSVIEMVTNDYIMSATEFLKSEKDLTKFQNSYESTSSNGGGGRHWGNPNIIVTSWLNLSFEGIDFGWGNEIHFGLAYEEIDGGFLILRDNNNDADHSVFVNGGLLLQHFEAFKNYFYNDI